MESNSSNRSLAIPDARHTPIPTGWLEQELVPAIATADWESLDDAEGRIKAIASYLDAHGADSVELEKALRVIEARRGELLPGSGHGGDRSIQVPRTELDVSPATASRWRTIARNWDWLWPEKILPAKNRAVVTQAKVLKYIDERIGTPDSELEIPSDHHSGDVHLLFGDFRERLALLPDNSVDLIITDPPYPNEFMPLWSDLAILAKRKLTPKGYLLAMSGKIHLDEVMARLGQHMKYGWVFNWHMEGAASRILSRNIRQTWKPILCYTPGTFTKREPLPDTVPTGAAEKDTSGWQQQVAPARWLIERFTPESGLVLDPFLGVGSFGIAAKESGRRFMGVELDPDRYEDARHRLLT